MEPENTSSPKSDQNSKHKNPQEDSSQEHARNKRPKNDHDGVKSVASTISIFLIAPIIALTLTKFVFQSYQVDGPSMETTLQNSDRLIVDKIPRTVSSITGRPYIPSRSDIIIFTSRKENDRQLIKRVVGLPGDRVIVKDGVLKIINKEHPDGYYPDKTYAYGTVITTTSGNIDLVVPENEVFVCGDNRPNSLDSRIFGTVKAEDIIAKLKLRIYPFNTAKNF